MTISDLLSFPTNQVLIIPAGLLIGTIIAFLPSRFRRWMVVGMGGIVILLGLGATVIGWVIFADEWPRRLVGLIVIPFGALATVLGFVVALEGKEQTS